MATFHSVKDAVKLFDAGFSHLNKKQEQGDLVEETNLCFWTKEVNQLKEKVKNVEKTKIDALLELEEAKKMVEHLNHKLRIRESMRNEKALDLLTSNVSELGIRQDVRNEKALDLSNKNVRVVTSELGFAKESLQRVAEEENELCSLVESLKLELQNVKKEHSKLKENEEIEREKLKKESEDAKTELLMLEEELKAALLEAEEAKAAEEHAKERLNIPKTLALQSEAEMEKSGGGGGELTETEALKACRDETLKTLEMSEREIQDIKAATQDALKKAEMAKEATLIVDAELKRRRKAASKILAETKMIAKSLPSAKEMHKLKLRSSSKEGCLVKC